MVADRGLISAANIDMVAEAGFDHLLATKLHRDRIATEALAAIDEDTAWVEIPERRCRAADVALDDGTRAVVVESDGRARRDVARTAEIVAAAEAKLRALEHRVRAGRLKDPAKIGAAAQRILGSGVSDVCSMSRSEKAGSSTTTTKTPTHTNSSSPAATC